MVSVETINSISNVKIVYKSDNISYKLSFGNRQFRTLMLARDIAEEHLFTELYELIIATSLNALDNEKIFRSLSSIDEFEITFSDKDGYKHTITK